MQTVLQVLSGEELSRIHEETLKILSATGVRVDTARGREILRRAGASVDETARLVRLPKELVEQCLQAAPKEFSLGCQRPGKLIAMQQAACAIVMDGGAVYTYDAEARQRRPATRDDWFLGTRLGDCLDDVDVYWSAVEGCWDHTPPQTVAYWSAIFHNFSKHVQDATLSPEESRWMLEVLQVVFGSREEITRLHPVSFVLCPASPLILEAEYTEAYLETLDYHLPAAIMTMPLMGISGPAALISQLILANCETLALLCLVQAAAPGTPVIYAAVPVAADMHSGRFGSGEVEHSLLGAAVTEIARYYHLPVEAGAGGSDQSVPGMQACYERALNFVLPVMSRPDLLVAPGLLGGSTIFSPEQMVIDLEIIRRSQRLARGIGSQAEQWLGEVISALGAGRSYLAHPTTRRLVRSGEIYRGPLGWHGPYDQWIEAGSPDLLAEAGRAVQEALARHQPYRFTDEAERELAHLEESATAAVLS